ncbi:CLUMA_CG009172, isoform A [Clunio marinus]|uniref:CLUMA_CG009172, isoform A n=1 Tax=Clunio marinus TaxID=568069 RepID=A0A1J1I696_9DIPT|nr:CLUMA_CG009172, isoform A [Clunio marinus]
MAVSIASHSAPKNREMFAIKKSYSIENGYPSRRRSLVDDARFESAVVKQTKQAVLEEARLKANVENELDIPNGENNTENDEEQEQPEVEEQEFYVEVEDDVYVKPVEGPSNGHQNEKKPEEKKEEEKSDDDSGLTEEEVVLQNAASQSEEAANAIIKAALVVRLRDGMGALGRILKAIETFKGTVIHLESRQSRESNVQFDVLIKIEMTRSALLQLCRSLRQSSAFGGVSLFSENDVSVKAPWFPKHASELDDCNHLMTKYEPDLDMNHPGFADKEYRLRRKHIAEVAFAYKYGDAIPLIEYTETENNTWSSVFRVVKDLMPKHACREYNQVFAKLEKEKIFVENRIPQLQEMNDFLRRNTGFTLRPAAGLLTSRDFLASLAFRVFQSTQYVRHGNSPMHTPEPDCIHELLGHMPLLGDSSFAQFSQEIGLASLGASDDEIEKLSTVYWFTVEFGLCKEENQVKAYGAGLLSAYGELLHAVSDKPEHRPFDPAKTAIQSYQDQEYQPIYYVAESFEDAKEKFRRWVATMSRPFEVRFNPHTERVEILDSVDKLETLVAQLNTEMLHLTNAIEKLKKPFC